LALPVQVVENHLRHICDREQRNEGDWSIVV
jgi:hypothetical protein